MAKDNFDVVVVGTQHSGLIAAGLLAKRGRRVLLLDQGEDITAYDEQGWRLPCVPTVLPMMNGASAWQRVHAELGIDAEVLGLLRPLDPSFQAIMPNHRIDIHRDRRRLHDELTREFPRHSGAIGHFFDRIFVTDAEITTLLQRAPALPPFNLWSRFRVSALATRAAHLDAPFDSHDFLSGVPFGHPLRELLFAPLHFFGHLGNRLPSTLHAARLIAQYYGGTASLDGGRTSLTELLLRAFTAAGGTWWRSAKVAGIEARRRQLTQARIADQAEAVVAAYFVANTVAPFAPLLAGAKRSKAFHAAEVRAQACGGLYVVNFVVASRVVPKGMAEALFLLNGRRSPREGEPRDPPMFLRRYPATRGEPASGQTSDHQIFSVACPVRLDEMAPGSQRLVRLRAQVKHRLGRVVPFLADALAVTSDVTDVASAHPTFEAAHRPLWGIAMLPTRTVFNNLLHCGRDVLPGLGLEGEYLTGLGVADRITGQLTR